MTRVALALFLFITAHVNAEQFVFQWPKSGELVYEYKNSARVFQNRVETGDVTEEHEHRSVNRLFPKGDDVPGVLVFTSDFQSQSVSHADAGRDEFQQQLMEKVEVGFEEEFGSSIHSLQSLYSQHPLGGLKQKLPTSEKQVRAVADFVEKVVTEEMPPLIEKMVRNLIINESRDVPEFKIKHAIKVTQAKMGPVPKMMADSIFESETKTSPAYEANQHYALLFYLYGLPLKPGNSSDWLPPLLEGEPVWAERSYSREVISDDVVKITFNWARSATGNDGYTKRRCEYFADIKAHLVTRMDCHQEYLPAAREGRLVIREFSVTLQANAGSIQPQH